MVERPCSHSTNQRQAESHAPAGPDHHGQGAAAAAGPGVQVHDPQRGDTMVRSAHWLSGLGFPETRGGRSTARGSASASIAACHASVSLSRRTQLSVWLEIAMQTGHASPPLQVCVLIVCPCTWYGMFDTGWYCSTGHCLLPSLTMPSTTRVFVLPDRCASTLFVSDMQGWHITLRAVKSYSVPWGC